MEFEGFITYSFTPKDFTRKSAPGLVYVACRIADEQEIPFYVGETHSVRNRLDDYCWADFQASTDFKVGEAVKYLCEKGFRVVVKIKASLNRLQEQNEIIARLRQEGIKLLNDCPGYKYETADEANERVRVHQFVDSLLSTAAGATAP
jgi:hypothetical protein